MKLKDYLTNELIPRGRYRYSGEAIGTIHEYSGITPRGTWVQVRILDSIMQQKTYLMRIIVGTEKYLKTDHGFDAVMESEILSAHRKRILGIGDMEV